MDGLQRETYIAFPTVFELSIGYQSRARQSEMISLIDRSTVATFASHADRLRQPALPVLLTRLGPEHRSLRLEAFVVHEASFDLLHPRSVSSSPVGAAARRLGDRSDATGARAALPTRACARSQRSSRAALRASDLDRGGYNLALIGGTTLERTGIPGLPSASALSARRRTFALHPRYTVVAHTGALTIDRVVVRGSWYRPPARPFAVRRTDTRLPDWGKAKS